MLLDCWSIPSVMLLTQLFVKTKCGFKKIAGVVVCVAGLILVVFSDVHADDRAGGGNPCIGDILVIAGATLYSIRNVSEGFLVKNADRVGLMAMLDLFGGIISAIQTRIPEHEELKSIHWSSGAVLPFVGFAVAMFVFYSLVPVLLNVDWMFFVAFASVAVGLVIHSGSEKDENQQQMNVDENAERRKQGDEEANLENHSKGNA